jgi:streptogramin lyase
MAAASAGAATVARVSGLDKPFGVAVGEGSVWVTEYERGYLVRIDAATYRVVARMRVGVHASHVLVQDGSAWVLDDLGGALIRVDTLSNRIVKEIPMRPTLNLRPTALAGDAGSVWVTLGSTTEIVGKTGPVGQVVRVDTATNGLSTIPIDGEAAGVTVGGGAVWVTTILREPSNIYRIDLATGRVVASLQTGHPVSGPVVYSDSGVWVANTDGFLTDIDSRTNVVVGNFDVGSPEWPAIVATGKHLWLSAPVDNLVAKFDPQAGGITATVHSGRRPQGFAVGGNDMWVANYGDGTVVRLPIP